LSLIHKNATRKGARKADRVCATPATRRFGFTVYFLLRGDFHRCGRLCGQPT
jgi:hypothetical protein